MTLTAGMPQPGHSVARTSSAAILAGFRAHGALPSIVAVQLATAAALRWRHPGMTNLFEARPVASTVVFLAMFLPFSALVICFVRIVRSEPAGSATIALLREIPRYATDRRRLANGLPVLALLVPFVTLFTYLKVNIPNIRPFAWDPTFERWDRALFGGSLPHELLQPLMGAPVALFATSIAYNVWFVVMWGTVFACAFMRNASPLRTRYLVAFFLVWFVEGNLLATLFPAAGPCFFDRIGHLPNPYGPLMETLRQASERYPIPTLLKQDVLWGGYLGHVEPLGISAMPSLHNATAVLMALAAWHVGRLPGIAFTAFAVWIFLGSISLAWHFAVDGLVAFAATVVLWHAAGHVARWRHADTRRRAVA